jgi:hypothetical protein
LESLRKSVLGQDILLASCGCLPLLYVNLARTIQVSCPQNLIYLLLCEVAVSRPETLDQLLSV